jgi:hypothetical protein
VNQYKDVISAYNTATAAYTSDLTAYNATVKTYNDDLAGDTPEDAKLSDIGDKPAVPWKPPTYSSSMKFFENDEGSNATLDASNTDFIDGTDRNVAYMVGC